MKIRLVLSNVSISPVAVTSIFIKKGNGGRKVGSENTESNHNDIDHTVFSFIPNTAEVAFYGMLQGLDDYLNEEKVQQIAALGHNPNMEELEVILSRRIRSEKVAIKDIKLRTFMPKETAVMIWLPMCMILHTEVWYPVLIIW